MVDQNEQTVGNSTERKYNINWNICNLKWPHELQKVSMQY